MSISIIIKLFAIAGQRAGWTKLADIFELKNSNFFPNFILFPRETPETSLVIYKCIKFFIKIILYNIHVYNIYIYICFSDDK